MMGIKLPQLFRKKSTEEVLDTNKVYVSLDVGTRYIKAVLFRKLSASEINIIGYARVAQKYGAMRDAMIVNIQQVIEACDLCIGRALATAEKRLGKIELPEAAVIGIAGELVKGVSIIASYNRKKPDQKITKSELESVIHQIQSDAFAGAVSQISEEIGVPVEQIREITTKIDTAEIDGVLVTNPEGFTGDKVTYRVYSTFAPQIHLNSLYELAHQLELETKSVVVQPYAIARAIKEVQSQNNGAIIIDMGGGTTDIAIVDNGGVVGTKMFAFGGDALTRRIADYFKIEVPVAEELKLDFSDGTLGDKQTKEIKAIVNQDLKIWVEGVQIALEELLDDEEGNLSTLPLNFYLCGGGAALPQIRETLLSHPWLTVLPFAKFPKFSYLYPNQLTGIHDETRLLIEPSDVTPASIARMLLE